MTVDAMMDHLTEGGPTIIHFSGHGRGHEVTQAPSPRPSTRDVEEDAGASAGIYLEDEHGRPQHVDATALAEMIRSAAPSARVVVLNACFSDALAEALFVADARLTLLDEGGV